LKEDLKKPVPNNCTLHQISIIKPRSARWVGHILVVCMEGYECIQNFLVFLIMPTNNDIKSSTVRDIMPCSNLKGKSIDVSEE
jgi:hypothetical protein